ncbi:ABC transporter ATP-binding protein [Paenibacillus thermotolerans]|uniref:ABC transporter ATP-binding protein n=1 Tax=Paenibacillus thermotolerans TaxID=3027807 RepID=UPI0023682F44|nr:MULTISPECIES: ABC transporter ATP-binding protein [unclassified Paenibacillus]
MGNENETVVQLQGVTKRIGGKTIVNGLTFEVRRGEVFGFLGPNGAGKTTSIRMMVGLMSITSGAIEIKGHNVVTDFERAIRHVGAIVENPEMYKYLSGWDNLVHFARMMGNISKKRIEEVVKLVGLELRIHDKVKTYSLGMRQRLGVAQALLHNPSVLILDEPTNGLDPAGIRELRDRLRSLAREEGLSVIVSSHLLSEMELMCDRVAIIQNGSLIDIRSLREDAAERNELTVEFATTNPYKAKEAIAAAGKSCSVEGDTMIVTVEREEIPALNEKLVASGIGVYSIRERAKSLEDQFLEVTGGNQIV